jgi:hypothetical protein
MQKPLLRRFKTNYQEPGKDDTFIGLPLSCMCYVELVPTRHHVLSDSPPELLNTGLKDWLPMVLTDFGTESILADLAVFQLRKSKDYEKNYSVLPEIRVMTKTCGMACSCRTTWKRTTPYRSAYGNAKDYSIRWDLVSRDRAVRLAKPILSSKRPLKKLLRVDERPRCATLVRGRSPFPAAQQPDKDVGSKRKSATCALTFGPSQSGFLRGTQSENRQSPDKRGSYFQCRDLWRLYSLSPRIYTRENIPYPGQCQMAQGERFERPVRVQSRPTDTNLPAVIFTRTQSGGTGLANHSPAGNAQPLFPLRRRVKNRFSISVYGMGAA